MSHPTSKKEALIPLKFMKKTFTPNKFFENGLPPPLKIINMVCTHPKIKGPVYEGGKIIKFYVKFVKNFMLGYWRKIKSECPPHTLKIMNMLSTPLKNKGIARHVTGQPPFDVFDNFLY